MSYSNYRYDLSKRDGSFCVLTDSEEEIENSFIGNSTTANTKIIEDSDTDSDNNLKNDQHLDKSDIDSFNSEEDDINFMNTSHRVSIIENSSDSEKDLNNEDTNKKANKFRRKSIYENCNNSNSDSEDSEKKIRFKRSTRKLRYISSNEENSSDNDEKGPAEHNLKRVINGNIKANITTDFSKLNDDVNKSEFLNKKRELSQYREINSEFDNTNDEKINLIQEESYDNNSWNKDNSPYNNNYKKSKKDLSKSPLILSKSTAREKSWTNGKVLSNMNSVFIINDSSDDCSKENGLKNKVLQNKQKADEAIVIDSSTNTSESEIDKDVIALAKKEIGVSNIDPIVAQMKEQLQLQIEFGQQKLAKVKKFSTSIDINLLPDKGLKVFEMIKQHEEEILILKDKLEKLNHKKETPETSKDKTEPKSNTELKELPNSSVFSDKDFNKKKSFEYDRTKNLNSNSNPKHLIKFDEVEIKSESKTSFDPSKLSEKALLNYNKQMTIADQRLEQLHQSLVGRPVENKKEKDPAGLKVTLMSHQQEALAWIKWRETQKPSGGILADDMGLGKTLTMISVILSTTDDDSSDDEYYRKYKNRCGGTLVICPASLINQWKAEIKNRCKRGILNTLVFHGNNRNMEERRLSQYDVVITTYQVLVREADAESSMYQMNWKRVIIDEAHYIRNHKSKACLAVCGLTANHKWALTGTPIQNKEMDLYAILKFLKCSPFDDFLCWKRWVDNKSEAGKQRLITIMKTLLLRRTKQELQTNGTLATLPDKNMEIIEIDMDHEETLVYQKILLFSQNLFAQFLYQRAEKQEDRNLLDGKYNQLSFSNAGSKTQFTKAQQILLDYHKSTVETHEILTLLLRLRQICCHPALIHSFLDKQEAVMNGLDDETDINTNLLNKCQNMSINEDNNPAGATFNYRIDEEVATNLLTKQNPVFKNDRRSSKVRAVLKTIKKIIEKGDKLVVVSQWTSFLKVVADNLGGIKNAKYAKFTGDVQVKDRQAIIETINDPDGDVNILLLSLTAGGVGLNIVGANHLLLIDIHWNPQLEAQAQDRIYRFGQNKDVYIYKFICKDTIEERVKKLQDNKLEMANHILTGTRLVSSKLTVQDLKLLFS